MSGVSERSRPGAENLVLAVAGRVGRKMALVAIARKLAVIMHVPVVLALVHGRDLDKTIRKTAAA